VQVTIYYNQEDQYLLDLVDQEARQERKSRSAAILTILEEHFEQLKKIGEILVDLGAVSHTDLSRGLDLQKSKFTEKLLGDILLEEGIVGQQALDQALMIQKRQTQTDN